MLAKEISNASLAKIVGVSRTTLLEPVWRADELIEVRRVMEAGLGLLESELQAAGVRAQDHPLRLRCPGLRPGPSSRELKGYFLQRSGRYSED